MINGIKKFLKVRFFHSFNRFINRTVKNDLIDVPQFDENLIVDGKFPVNYKLPKDEYMEKVKAFQNEVTKIITSTLSEGDNELEKAMKLYGYFGPNMTYDYDLRDFALAESEGDCIGVEKDYTTDNVIPEGYRAIMYKEGICHELASAYRFSALGTCSYYEWDQENQGIYYGYSYFNGEHYEEEIGEFEY